MSLEINNQKSESLKWDTRVLKDVVDVYIGKTPPRKEHKWFSETEGVKWVSIKDLGNCGIYVKDTSEYLTHNAVSKFNVRVAPKNTVLLSFKLTVGRVAITTENMVTNEAIAHFIIKNEKKLSRLYLYYYLKTFNYNTLGSTSSIAKAINSKMVREIPITLPPIEIQDKISKILFNIDSKIEVINDINNNLESLAKSIYKYHFIDFEPYSKYNFKSTALGEIPENWSVQSIEEFVDDMKNGGTPKRGESDFWDNGHIPWLKTGEINNNIIIKSEEYITKSGLKNSSAKLLPKNSIILALYGKGTAARIGLLKIEATTNQACCAMICNDFNKTMYLYLFLLVNQKEIENLATGSVQQNLSKDLIANLNLIIPPEEIFRNLPFKEIYNSIANNIFEIDYLTKLRDTLLPKLMSGEIDVSKINCDLKLIIKKIILKFITLFYGGFKYENKNNIKNSKSNETFFKPRTIFKINKQFIKLI